MQKEGIIFFYVRHRDQRLSIHVIHLMTTETSLNPLHHHFHQQDVVHVSSNSLFASVFVCFPVS